MKLLYLILLFVCISADSVKSRLLRGGARVENIDEVETTNSDMGTQTRNCTGQSSCSDHGDCSSDFSTCKCNDRYITYPAGHYPMCNYRQYSQLVAFLLEFFFGEVGGGEWYIHNNNIAMWQLSLGIIIPLCICVAGACLVATCCKGNEAMPHATACCMCMFFFSAVVWGIVTWIRIAMGEVTDGKGAPLYSNM